MEVCTFDCYGTLIDWEGGMGNFLYAVALRSGEEAPPNGGALRERWEQIQFEVIGGDYRPYKQVLVESLHVWAEEAGYPLESADDEAVVRAMRSWQPFPDTRPALTRVREAGVKLIIVSNTDSDIVEHSLRHMAVPFDHVVTAEDVRSYKPADPHFERALEVAGVPVGEILHVAFGFKYDIGPAQRRGMGSAWINRSSEPAPGPEVPDHEWRDLWGLAELAES